MSDSEEDEEETYREDRTEDASESEEKEGVWDKGPPLTADTVNYFKSLYETIATEDAESEELLMVARAALEEVKGKEYRLAVNKHCSLVLEKIIPSFTESQLIEFGQAIVPCFASLATDRIASHVTQRLLLCIEKQLRTQGAGIEVESTGAVALGQLFQDLCRSLDGFWLKLLESAQGTHILRAVLSVACAEGTMLSLEACDAVAAPATSARTARFPDVLTAFALAVCELSADALCEMGFQAEKSACLQSLLLALHRHERPELSSLTALILGPDSSGRERTTNLLRDPIGSRLIQVLLAVSGAAQVEFLFETYYLPCLLELAQHPHANLSLQDALATLQAPVQLKQCVRELGPHFAELIRANKAGVIAQLVRASHRLQVGRVKVFKFLKKAVSTVSEGQSDNFVQVLLDTKKLGKDVIRRSGRDGAAILQALLEAPVVAGAAPAQSEGPLKVVEDLMKLEVKTLVAVCTDSHGSRVVESALSAPCALHASKQALIGRLGGHLGELGKAGPGAYVVEKAYRIATPKLRLVLALELQACRDQLRTAPSGKRLLLNCHVASFIKYQRDKRWEEAHQRKRWQLFRDFCEQMARQERESAHATRRGTPLHERKAKTHAAQPTETKRVSRGGGESGRADSMAAGGKTGEDRPQKRKKGVEKGQVQGEQGRPKKKRRAQLQQT